MASNLALHEQRLCCDKKKSEFRVLKHILIIRKIVTS
jgi:hypothetical protein